MRSEIAAKSRSSSKTPVTSEMRSMKTKLRSLRKESWSAWSTERKKVDAELTEVETSQST